MDDFCQSCRTVPVAIVEALDDPAEPYRLCRDCHRRLINHSLRPREWYHLCAFHGRCSDWLSSEYYDEESGMAVRPSEPVTDAALLPCPRLDEVAESPEDLLAFVLSRQHYHEEEQTASWHIADDLISALRRHSPIVLSEMLRTRLEAVRSAEIGRILLHVVGIVLGEDGAALVQANWERLSKIVGLPGMAFAASRCLPTAEAHKKVTDALARMDPPSRVAAKLVLMEFATPLNLDWIEKNADSPVDSTWGLLAASSAFDWPRARKWLDSGRPLSLVALDALEWCVCSGRKPPLLDSPEPEEFIRCLRDYQARDPVVRVRERVERLVGFNRLGPSDKTS